LCRAHAGMVYDKTHNYDNSFHVGGAMLLAGGLLVCLLHLPQLRRFAATNTDSVTAELPARAEDEKRRPHGASVKQRRNEMTLTVRDNDDMA